MQMSQSRFTAPRNIRKHQQAADLIIQTKLISHVHNSRDTLCTGNERILVPYEQILVYHGYNIVLPCLPNNAYHVQLSGWFWRSIEFHLGDEEPHRLEL